MKLRYINPIYSEYFADPFIMQYKGVYYAFGTAPTVGSRVLPALTSFNLTSWTEQGGTLIPPHNTVEFWAPEVVFRDGIFYMYYSASHVRGYHHQLRVAQSTHPLGPFEDTGLLLVPDQPFTIDAHPFRDEDGTWYLFYARDFLSMNGEHRVGTGIVVDRLLDMVTLAGSPKVVVRPHLDWHLFKRQRPIYGSIYDWYTVEGPAVLKHDGHYYCFYSGGSWEQDNYGVSFVIAEHPLGPYFPPDDLHLQVLRSQQPHLIGPGHNAFIKAPNDQTLIIYHAWDSARTGRYMHMDKLLWAAGIPHVNPTWTPTEV
jgi:GH43 family beta-xylosidase